MKIYTKTGDKGTTSLYGGKRLAKHAERIKAYGSVDELNAWIGLILAEQRTQTTLSEPTLSHQLEQIQRQLFDIGAHLATPYAADQPPASLPQLSEQSITELEQSIDAMTAQLPSLTTFILPGGSIISAHTHIARTVCRRTERRLTTLAEREYIASFIVKYCNRLSDWLFTLARFYNSKVQQAEPTWK